MTTPVHSITSRDAIQIQAEDSAPPNPPVDPHRSARGRHRLGAGDEQRPYREQTLVDRYHSLLTKPDAELRDALGAMIRAECALPEGERAAFAHTRLRAWLAMDREDARIIARAYEEAMERFSPAQREQRLAAERDAIMNGLRFAEFRSLCGIVPWLRSEASLQVLFPEHVASDTNPSLSTAGAV